MTDLFDICGIPAFLEPWITRFYAPLELDLLTALDGNAMTADEACEKLGPESANSFLELTWRRGVVCRQEDGRIAAANFRNGVGSRYFSDIY